jgi:hypothetical protein
MGVVATSSLHREMRAAVLAYCGIDCAACSAFTATLKADLKTLAAVGAKYSKGEFAPEDWVCLGCHPGNRDFLAKYCRTCAIRDCAMGRSLQSCACCDDFEDCQKLQPFLKDEGSEPQRTMALLRRTYQMRDRAEAKGG